jgi:hypothetical protein
MRVALLATIVLANAAAAGDCVPLSTRIVVKGSVEYRYEGKSGNSPFEIFLHLEEPLCVTGLGSGYSNSETFRSVQLGIPPHLNQPLKNGSHVKLVGRVGQPAVNDPLHRVIFSVAQVR